MVERLTPLGPLIQDNNENAEPVREMVASLVKVAGLGEGSLSGVVAAGDFAVSQHAGTPGMNVDIAAGRAFIQGAQTNFQGSYHVSNDAVVTKAIAASDPTNPRIDIVVATVRDKQYPFYTQDDWLIQVVTGTPSATPAAPATPTDSVLLAQVAVAATVASILNANITDKRVRAGTTRYHASVHSSIAQNESSGVNAILALNVADYDPSGSYNISSYTFTCPVAGIYLVNASYLDPMYVPAGTGDRSCFIVKNGVQGRELGRITNQQAATGGNDRVGGMTTVLCAAGDQLQIWYVTGGSVANAVVNQYADFIFLGPL